MSHLNAESVLTVRHWTDRLFSFTTTRDPAFRFRNGQFTMIGLEVEGRPLLRAYSMVSANHEEQLEFFSIKAPDGPLTSRLQKITAGDRILVSRKAVGTLIQDSLRPGRRLWLLATGTGLAPFLSIIKDPDAYERYEQIILAHGCRQTAELAYRAFITETLPQDEFLGGYARTRLLYYPTVTREAFCNQGRVTDLLRTGKLAADLGLPPPCPAEDRFMLCGSPDMLADATALLDQMGYREGSASEPADYVIEKAFVEK